MILGTGAKKKHNPMGTLTLVFALLLCLCVNSWAACSYQMVNNTVFCKHIPGTNYGACGTFGNCNGLTCEGEAPLNYGCNGGRVAASSCYSSDGVSCNNAGYSCYKYSDISCNVAAYQLNLCCDTQAEADSVACAQNPGAEGCGPVQDTETMSQLESRCQAIDGEPHYSYNDSGHVVGWCDICQTDENGNYTNRFVQNNYNTYKESCCQVGKAPKKSDFTCKSTANGCAGVNCDWFNGVGGGGIGYSEQGLKTGICEVNVSMSVDGTIAGCEDDQPGSSGSGESSPSSSGSSDSGVSSSGTNDSSASMEENTQLIADGVGAIIDSLHKIIVIDSMNRTYDSLVAVFTSTIASLVDEINQKEIGGGDTTIINIPRDTNVVNVNVGQAAVVSAIENMSAENQQIATKILAESDTSNELLKGILGALDTSKYNDSNVVKILSDTIGSGGDTAGWGTKLDSISDWLKDSTSIKDIFGSGSGAFCDTTGGKKCNMAGSLDSAAGSWGTTYKALGDSLTQGAVGDSLARWESMLTQNGVITGSGSNSCPSVFSRQFTINIGSGIEVQTPALGQYVCATIPGTSITFWTLARVVIRAMVAITCMWWLYGAVTGVKNDGGDDD